MSYYTDLDRDRGAKSEAESMMEYERMKREASKKSKKKRKDNGKRD